MANQYKNKIVFDGNVLIDLSSDTVTAEKLLKDITAHDKSGALITGTLVPGSLPSEIEAIDSGTYTPASDITTSFRISHSLGVIPDLIVFWTEEIDWVSSTGAALLAAIAFPNVANRSTASMTNRNYVIYGRSSSSVSVTRTTSYGIVSRPTTTQFQLMGGVSSTAPIKGGKVYKWVAVKFAD